MVAQPAGGAAYAARRGPRRAATAPRKFGAGSAPGGLLTWHEFCDEVQGFFHAIAVSCEELGASLDLAGEAGTRGGNAFFVPAVRRGGPLLGSLPDELLVYLSAKHGLTGRDLAGLECASALFSSTPRLGLSLAETGARVAVLAGGSGLQPRSGESWKEVLEFCVLLEAARERVGGHLAASHHYTLACDDAGALFSYGYGMQGQLGHVAANDAEAPPQPASAPRSLQPVEDPALRGVRVAQVCASVYHTVVLTSAGDVYSSGLGLHGQLGHGSTHSEAQLRRIEAFPAASRGRALHAAVGLYHTLVLCASGRVFSFGDGKYGRLGNGSQRRETLPHLVGGVLARSAPAVMVGAGEQHSVVLTADGKVFTFGWAGNELALGGLGHRSLDVQLLPRPVTALEGEFVMHIAAGPMHTAITTREGRVYTCGCASLAAGSVGRLGHGDDAGHELEPRRVSALDGLKVVRTAPGYNHTVFLTSVGAVFTSGEGRHGRLGHGTLDSHTRPKRVAALAGVQCSDVAAGVYHTVVRADNGDVYVFGLVGPDVTEQDVLPRKLEVADPPVQHVAPDP